MKHYSRKILNFSEAESFLNNLKGKGNSIVQCHGTFDLIHPGHIIHFEEAKALGDILVVSVTSSTHVNKGPGRPYFNDEMRLHTLASLECIDYVILIPFPDAVESIRCVKPKIYCKGVEYQDAENDVTGNIYNDISEVKAHGGEIHYVGSVIFSSTKLINKHFNHIPLPVKEFCSNLSSRISIREFREMVSRFENLRVLVVGDTIIDQYAYLSVQGLTSKNRIISGRFIKEDTHAGGALAILRHVKQFCAHVRFVSLIGTESWAGSLVNSVLQPHENAVVNDPNFTTIVKKRYVEPVKQGNEITKLFSINYIDQDEPAEDTKQKLVNTLKQELKNCDVVLLADFGHGMMAEEVRNLVQNEAPFLVLNCQTNSNNHGFNIINRQYQRADAFSLDSQELILSCGIKNPSFEKELAKISKQFNSKYSWLTRGNIMTIGQSPNIDPVYIPPLDTEVTDTVGAGDAFFSLAGLAAGCGLPLDVSTFLAQLAGSQAVNIIGNEKPVSKETLLKTAISLLNF